MRTVTNVVHKHTTQIEDKKPAARKPNPAPAKPPAKKPTPKPPAKKPAPKPPAKKPAAKKPARKPATKKPVKKPAAKKHARKPAPKKPKAPNVEVYRTNKHCAIRLLNKAQISGNPKQNQLRRWNKTAPMNAYFMHAAPQRKKFRSVTCPKGKRMKIATFRNRPGKNLVKTPVFGGRQLSVECRCDKNEKHCSFKAIYKKIKGKRHQLVFSGKGKLGFRRPNRKWAITHGVHVVHCV